MLSVAGRDWGGPFRCHIWVEYIDVEEGVLFTVAPEALCSYV